MFVAFIYITTQCEGKRKNLKLRFIKEAVKSNANLLIIYSVTQSKHRQTLKTEIDVIIIKSSLTHIVFVRSQPLL